jgi:hypothetical protein
MAGHGHISKLLRTHSNEISRDLDLSKVLPTLVRRGVFSKQEELEILQKSDLVSRNRAFVERLQKKGLPAFHEFCVTLEYTHPHLLTKFLLLDNPGLSVQFHH